MIISMTGGYYQVWSCAKIASELSPPNSLSAMYPACEAYVNGSNPGAVAEVWASLDGETGVNAGAALNSSFGAALWLAFALHALGVEIYVSHLEFRKSRSMTDVYLAQPHSTRSRPSTEGQLPKAAGSRHAQPWICGPDCGSIGRCREMVTREGKNWQQ